jgi:hypothetical protein
MRPFHTTLMECECFTIEKVRMISLTHFFLVFHKNFADEIKSLKEKNEQEAATTEQAPLSITTSSIISRRRSTLSGSTTTENSSILHQQNDEPNIKSIGRQNSTVQTPGLGGIPVLPALPVMSPISRAFSIRTPVTENSPGLPSSSSYPNSAFDNATMSRAESLSRTLKMSLRSKKSRKKSQSAGSIHQQSNSNISKPTSKP